MAARVFHWRHGWIPLDHTAASEAGGVRTRRDVAHSVRSLPSVPSGDRLGPKHETIAAAHRVGAQDLLPKSWHGQAPAADRHVAPEDVAAFRGGSAEAHLVTDAQGRTVFSPERQALHDRIVASMVDGHAAQARPEYHLMGGGPAAGKSTMMDAVPARDAALVNADDVKAQLPEYVSHGAAGAAFTHEESSYIAKQALAEAFRRRVNVTLDGTGDSSLSSLTRKIDAARAAGYSVHGHYVTVPTEVAVQRAVQRAARTGRHVPRSVIEDTHRSVSQVLPQAVGHFDTLDVFDNAGSLTPILRKDLGGQPKVLDDGLWQAFLAKGR